LILIMMYAILKRIFDLLVSSIALIVLSPILIITILACRFTAEKEVFYFQKRIGFKNKYFDIWKFATMIKNSPNMGTKDITLRNDPRVTPVGKYLRKSKINELPQIINVFKGDMSIVGPRPLVDKTFNAYPEDIQKIVYNSKPGITGIGSLIFRDEEKLISDSDMDPHDFYKQEIAPYKGALEKWYQSNKSMTTDLILTFLTAWSIIFPESQLAFKIFKDLPQKNWNT